MKRVPGGDNLVKDVQCYELFRGIAFRNHAFSFSFNYLSFPILLFTIYFFNIYYFTTYIVIYYFITYVTIYYFAIFSLFIISLFLLLHQFCLEWKVPDIVNSQLYGSMCAMVLHTHNPTNEYSTLTIWGGSFILLSKRREIW